MGPMLGEGLDRDEGLEVAHALPVGQQLVLVRERPFLDQPQCSRGQRACEQCGRAVRLRRALERVA